MAVGHRDDAPTAKGGQRRQGKQSLAMQPGPVAV